MSWILSETASAATLNLAEVKKLKLDAAGTDFSEVNHLGTWFLSTLCVTAAALGDRASKTTTKSLPVRPQSRVSA